MLLSGIGSGLTGKPNLAIEMLNREMDADIDAQKVDIEKKNSLLGHYMQETNNLLTSQRLTKADMLDMYAAKMQGAALAGSSDEAKARAQTLGGQFRTMAQQMRAQAQIQDFQTKQTVVNANNQQAIRQLIFGNGGRSLDGTAPSPQRQMLLSTFVEKPEKWAEHSFNVPEEKQIGSGKTGRTETVLRSTIAPTPQAAEKAREALQKNQEQMQKLQALKQFTAAHGAGTWSPADNQTAQSLTNDFLLSWNQSQEGLSRVNPAELELVQQMMGNPGGWWSGLSGKTAAAMTSLERAVKARQGAIVDAYEQK
jgi:hypothetical protein